MSFIASKSPNILINVVDINKKRIEAWNSENFNDLPIFEPRLREIIIESRGKNLFFTTNIDKSIEDADMIFISVNTPIKKAGLGAGFASDLRWVEASARRIAEHAKGHTIVVEKSTLPVKTAETIKSILISSNNTFKEDKTFSVLSNPEFLSEGTAINDLENPDRVLIGEDKEAMDELKKFI